MRNGIEPRVALVAVAILAVQACGQSRLERDEGLIRGLEQELDAREAEGAGDLDAAEADKPVEAPAKGEGPAVDPGV